jgi:hypothetical protein
MLIYHPAFDAFHCVFRMLAVSRKVENLEVDKARLLDFYLLFPAAIAAVRLPAALAEIRKLSAALANVYHDPVSPISTFREMHHIQDAALKCIAAAGLIDLERYEAGFVTRTTAAISEELADKVDAFLADKQPLADLLLCELASLPLCGHDGLKHRTELMEHRYDVA